MRRLIYLYKAVVSNYLYLLAGMFFSFVAIIVVFCMLIHIKDFYSNYKDVTAGFVPDLKLRFDRPIAEKEIAMLIEELKSSHEVKNIQRGYIKELGNTRFDLSSGRKEQKTASLDKNISVIGFKYDGENKIELFQGGEKFEAEVVNIDYFGHWFINIRKDNRLEESRVHLPVKGQKINLEAVDSGSCYTLQLSDPDSSDQLGLLYDFLVEFAERFAILQNTGIPSNRFEEAENREGELYARKIFIKRKLLGVFGLVLSGRQNDINSILSSSLHQTISRYNKTQRATLETGGQSFPIRIIDFFNLNAENFYNNNTVLMNYEDFSELFEVEGKINTLFIYGNDFSQEEVVEDISSHYPDSNFVLRHDAIPTLHVQTKIVEYSIYFLLGVFFAAVLCIVSIRLLKFYMVFKYELVFMKLHGYQGLIFSNLMAGLFLVSLGAGYATVKFLLHLNNKILSGYYFPEVQMNVLGVAVPAVVCAAIVTGAYFMEKWQFDRLEYSTREAT